MPIGKTKRPSIRPSRRSVLQAGAAIVGGYFIAPEAGWGQAIDGEKLSPRQHGCLELPVINPDWSNFEKVERSPVELALRMQDGTASAVAPAAAMRAANSFPGYPDGSAAAPGASAAYASRWQNLANNTLRLFFMNGADLIDPVMAAITAWSRAANVKFDRARDASRAELRIMFGRSLGHQSQVGSEARQVRNLSQPTMTLGFRDLFDYEADAAYSRFVVMHEFGHALGCIHEHIRDDAPLVFNEAKTIAYFATRGLNAAATRYNILERWRQTLIRKSEYDEKSIMHYMLPGFCMADGRERQQNFELSGPDKEFAAIVYGPPPGDPSSHGEQPERPRPAQQSSTLAVNGEPTSLMLAAGRSLSCTFSIPMADANQPFVISSEGGTQVVLSLFGPNDAISDITPAGPPGHGTYDLTNDMVQANLAAGDYVVQVRHPAPRGGGKTSLSVRSGKKLERLLPANKMAGR
jgi:Astacin (Peptidase family M12A)